MLVITHTTLSCLVLSAPCLYVKKDKSRADQQLALLVLSCAPALAARSLKKSSFMSLITDDPGESPRDCATKHHHHHHGSIRRRRRVLIAVSSATASLVSLSIILWLTLRPSSPTFSLLAATVVSYNATAGATLVVDAAFVAHNPNARAAALYDRLQLHVLELAAASPIPPFQQPQGDVVVSASASAQAPAMLGTTALLLRLRVQGQLRWKVAAWVSARHAITADCVAVVPPPQQLRAVVVQGSQCPTTLD